MSFYRKLIATVAAFGLATSVFAADEAAMQSATDATTTTTTTTQTTDVKATTTQVNLNTATAEELAAVHGLNKKKAEMIVKYRNDNGNFTSVDDLKKVKGLGLSMKKMKKVQSQLTIG
jgi:competence protein ComEA